MEIKMNNGSVIKTAEAFENTRGKIRRIPQDCLSCGQSMVTDEDNLFCVFHQKEVNDDGYCEEYN